MIRSRSFVWIILITGLALTSGGRTRAVCDTTPPELSGFSFDPAIVDVTASSAAVTCTMMVRDQPAGVSEARCQFTSMSFFQQQSCTADVPSAGDRFDGTFQCSLTVPQYADSGTWTASVDLTDGVGNERTLSFVELDAAGFPTELTVVSTPDFGPPSLSEFTFAPDTVNVSAGPATVTCDMTFTDFPAGVDVATCQFQSPDAFQIASCSADAPISGDRTNGTFRCGVEIQRYADAGTWTATVIGTDGVGNVFFADGFLLSALGFPFELGVSSIPEDVTGPQLVDFTLSTTSVDVSNSPAMVTCTMEFTDTPAGVFLAACLFESPSQQQQQSCFSITPTSGTPQAGTYECTAVIPAYSEGGVWQVGVFSQDRVLNGGALPAADMLDVVCDGAEEPRLLWDSATLLTWNAIAGAVRYNVYRGFLSDLDLDYGSCQNARDPNLTDTMFVENQTPPLGEGFQFLVSVTTATGEGGLGRASDGTPRTVGSACP